MGRSSSAIWLGLIMAGAAVGFAGCQNTAAGIQADAQTDRIVVENSADKAGEKAKVAAAQAMERTKHAAADAAIATKTGAARATVMVKHAAHNFADATTLTPKVKNAITANKTLNNPKNLINVDSKDGAVMLKGHVIDNGQKKLAGEVAAKAVAQSGSKDIVKNELAVSHK